MHYILFYEYVPDYMERRSNFRDAHFAHAKQYVDRGELFLGGAFANPADGAAIVFKGDNAHGGRELRQGRPLRHQRLGHTLDRAGVDHGRRARCGLLCIGHVIAKRSPCQLFVPDLCAVISLEVRASVDRRRSDLLVGA